MDKADEGRNPRRRTIPLSSLRRVKSLPISVLISDPYRVVQEYDGLTIDHPLSPAIDSSYIHGSNDQQLIDHVPVGPFHSSSSLPVTSEAPFDVNLYQQKKTLAQGIMDLALISANANQMRYVLQLQDQNFFSAAMCMIIMSLILQVVVGIGLIWNSRYNVKEETHTRQANKTNNWTVIGIFLVTILNFFISSFGVSAPIASTINKDVLHPENYDIPINVDAAANT